MTSATVSDIQHNLAAYLRRVEAGEAIEIRRHNKVVARLVPENHPSQAPSRRVDWEAVAARRKRLWGGDVAPGKPVSEIVCESRGDY